MKTISQKASEPVREERLEDPPDPVIEAYKKDVDRTLLIENLRLTSDERSRKFLRNMELVYELLASNQPKSN